jgi:hypothetical protein
MPLGDMMLGISVLYVTHSVVELTHDQFLRCCTVSRSTALATCDPISNLFRCI